MLDGEKDNGQSQAESLVKLGGYGEASRLQGGKDGLNAGNVGRAGGKGLGEARAVHPEELQNGGAKVLG